MPIQHQNKFLRTEALAGVQGVKALASGAAIHAVALDQAHEDDLARQGGNDALCMDQGRVAQVVQASRSEDLCASLEPAYEVW